MLTRTYIYLHVSAVLLTALVAYWDRIGFYPSGLGGVVFNLGVGCVYMLPVFPITALAIICLSNVSRQQKLRTAIIAGCATVAQLVAAIPLVQ